ncbi:LysM peptidoglycan-binding domain-containing protein [Bacillus sp. B1-b2]|uniref:LysM peptidoglycan-binding domain-containing protein n=1 Tax=Bacillus sp. B1-b2 TaxID=2653201 RepID=UPI001261B68B|nr:LysM peptidoglycan-binding domain-containing protein [Bacillus sp. B1-b2]KAB7672906.1 LysM peptidoglycan-binding domain-containing protein [Bacillus sp. B1-b2]
MKKEDPYRIKAELHKEKLTRVNRMEEKEIEHEEESNALPSRSSIHAGKKRKWKTPIISSLAILFILLPVSILGINSMLKSKGLPTFIPSEATSSFFERVSITEENDNQANEKNTKDMENKAQETEEAENILENDDTEENQLVSEETELEGQETNREEPQTNTEEQEVATEVMDNSSVDSNIIYHQVKKGETLFEIALKYYPAGDGMEKIKALNNLKTNDIQAGQTLKIVLN